MQIAIHKLFTKNRSMKLHWWLSSKIKFFDNPLNVSEYTSSDRPRQKESNLNLTKWENTCGPRTMKFQYKTNISSTNQPTNQPISKIEFSVLFLLVEWGQNALVSSKIDTNFAMHFRWTFIGYDIVMCNINIAGLKSIQL